MVIIKLKGGLGNQMFQFAFGRKLALLNNTSLLLDTLNGYKNDRYRRNFKLDVFNIKADYISRKYAHKLRFYNYIFRAINKVNLNFKFRDLEIIKEVKDTFDPNVLKPLNNNIYCDGYWQTEKYFKDIKEIIISDFTLKHINNKIKPLLEEIENCNSVSIHIRDYKSLPNGKLDKAASIKYADISSKYYNSAIEYIKDKNNKIKLFVFTDNICLSKNILNLDYHTVFVSGNKDYEDLFLMSKCNNNIIANSSFSWWAAWLNKNRNKVVIAPSKWYDKANIETRDLLPDNWIKI